MRRMYSEQQIVKVVEGVDLKPKTIEQQEANWSLDISELEMSGLGTGLEYSPIYERLEQIGNVLYVVLTFKIANNTESAIAVGNTNIVVDIPETIGDKLVDFNGDKVTENAGSSNGRVISADLGFRGDNTYEYGLNRETFKCIIEHSAKNKVQIKFFAMDAVNSGKNIYYCCRTFLTLL